MEKGQNMKQANILSFSLLQVLNTATKFHMVDNSTGLYDRSWLEGKDVSQISHVNASIVQRCYDEQHHKGS